MTSGWIYIFSVIDIINNILIKKDCNGINSWKTENASIISTKILSLGTYGTTGEAIIGYGLHIFAYV